MAKIKNGFLDAFEGKLGPAVGYRWKSKHCVRSLPQHQHDPRTPAQLAQRERFRTLSRVASAFLPATRIGFRGPADKAATTEYNCFMQANKGEVVLVDGKAQVGFAGLRVSDGPLPQVYFGQPLSDGDGTVAVDFTADAGQTDDYVLLFAYAPTLEQGRLSLPVHRCRRRIGLVLPDEWHGCETHFYGFCWDGDMLTSPSTHVGAIHIAD